MRTRNLSNLVKIPITKTHSPRTEFVPKIMLTNVMSLVPKLDELRILTSAQSFDLGFTTETWLRESVCDTDATLFDYHLVRRDRSLGIHGGVCMYIKNSIISVSNDYMKLNIQTLRFYGHTLDHQDYQGELTALFLHASTILQVPAIQIFFNTYLTH